MKQVVNQIQVFVFHKITYFFLIAIKKCASIAGLFNHSSKFKEILYKQQQELGKPCSAIVQQVPTRWNSLYFMLKSILKTNEALFAALYEENYTSFVLSSDQLTYIEEACEILEYFEQVTIRIIRKIRHISFNYTNYFTLIEYNK